MSTLVRNRIYRDNLTDSYLNPRSTSAGGLNTSDSTSRLVLESFQKAQINNDGATNVGQAHYGEVLRIRMKHQQAKGAIAFQEDYLGAGYPRTVAWLVAHGEANDSTPSVPVWHNHFSVELPDENGALQTSFEFPFGTYNVPNAFGVPLAEMYNRSTTKLIAANQGLHVENAAGVNKNVYFSSGTRGLDANKRWGLQADSTAESGSSAGTNFRINRYNDSGTFVASPLFIRRSNGQVGINNTSPAEQLDVVGNVKSTATITRKVTVNLPDDKVGSPGIPDLGAYGYAEIYIGSDGTKHNVKFVDGDGDGDVDFDQWSKGNRYEGTEFQFQFRPRMALQNGVDYGRLVIDNAASLDGDGSATVYIQSGLNYAGTTYADLAFTRYGAPGFHWGRFDESQNGYFILGKNAGQTAVARLHVYDGATTVGFFEGNQTSTRITFKASATTGNTTVGIGATGDDLFLRAGGATRLTITSTGDITVAGGKITNVTDPTAAQDAATKAYVDARFATGQTYTTSNVTTTRTLDADSIDIFSLADVVGTLIADLKTKNILT